jgi:hypothetical protein
MKLEELIKNFRQVMNESKKKNCQPGMPYHGKDGKFVNPYEEAGSWSLGKGKKTGADCNWGQASRKGANKSQQFVKRKCGRGGKYRCKDSSIKEIDVNEDYVMGPSGEIMAADLRNVSENDLLSEIERRIDEGQMNRDQILRICSAINQSSKGEYPPN